MDINQVSNENYSVKLQYHQGVNICYIGYYEEKSSDSTYLNFIIFVSELQKLDSKCDFTITCHLDN